jgi:hypothetical protein
LQKENLTVVRPSEAALTRAGRGMQNAFQGEKEEILWLAIAFRTMFESG